MSRFNALQRVDSRRLPFLKEVVIKWSKVIEKLSKEWNWEDVPWGYSERALLSTFAAAVWKCGSVAFEEYSTEKKSIKKRYQKGDLYTGRCDLYFKIGKREFVAEAKHIWSPAGKKAYNPILEIQDAFDEAISVIKRTKSYGGERKLAIVFAAPYIPTSQKAAIDGRIKSWVSKIRQIKYSSVAWVFPSWARIRIKDKRWFYPGVALLIKEVY